MLTEEETEALILALRLLAEGARRGGDFRSFRVDRIASLRDTGRVQAPEVGRDLAAWRARMGISG